MPLFDCRELSVSLDAGFTPVPGSVRVVKKSTTRKTYMAIATDISMFTGSTGSYLYTLTCGDKLKIIFYMGGEVQLPVTTRKSISFRCGETHFSHFSTTRNYPEKKGGLA